MTPTNSFEVLHGTQNRNSRVDQREDGNDPLPGAQRVEGLFLFDGRASRRKGQMVRQLPAAAGTLSEARPGYGCAVPSSSSLGESYDQALYAWGQPKFSETELRVWSNQELRQLVVRPSKIRRLYEALKSIVLGELSYRWYQFKTWRRGNSDGAGNYRSLEFAVMFVATAFLFECCVVAFCKGVGR